MRKTRGRTVVILLALLLLLFLCLGLDHQVVVTRYRIADDRVAGDFKIVLLTDTHSCSFGDRQAELVTKVTAEAPDLILLGGDIIDDVLPLEQGLETVAYLAPICPTFYVTGNHEIWSRKATKIKAAVREQGVEVLEGTVRELEIKNNRLTIAGLDDPEVGGERYQQELDSLADQDLQGLTLLLAHRPERLNEYEQIAADYVFSGHAHGGQWRLPLVLEHGLLAPNQGLFPQLTVSVHHFDRFTSIISRGLSRESTRVPRFFNPPEIVVVSFQGS